MSTYDSSSDSPIATETRIVRGFPLTGKKYSNIPGKPAIGRGWYVDLNDSLRRLYQTFGPFDTANAAFDAVAQWLQEHGH